MLKFIFLIIFLAVSLDALAFTEKDYTKYLKENPILTHEDSKMNDIWKLAKKILSYDNYNNLLISQRKWLSNRNHMISKLIEDKVVANEIDALILITRDRIKYIEYLVSQSNIQNEHNITVKTNLFSNKNIPNIFTYLPNMNKENTLKISYQPKLLSQDFSNYIDVYSSHTFFGQYGIYETVLTFLNNQLWSVSTIVNINKNDYLNIIRSNNYIQIYTHLNVNEYYYYNKKLNSMAIICPLNLTQTIIMFCEPEVALQLFENRLK